MAQLFDTGVFSVTTSTGGIGVGWKLNFYITGTTTRKDTYPTEADALALTNANTNPVVLAADGRIPAIWLLEDIAYKLVLTDAADVVKMTMPQVAGLVPTSAANISYANSGTGAITTTVSKKLREEASLWDLIPDAYRTAIEAGSSTQDVTSYINQALINYQRVIVRRGTYRFSTPILFANSEQTLEFEDGAWFHPLIGTTNGIAVPHNFVDTRLINPGLIGEASSATGACAILVNSNVDGTAANSSATSDVMGGQIENARFKQASGTKAWSIFIDADMAGGLYIRGVDGKGLWGTVSGKGYGVLVSGTDITLRDIDVNSVMANQGRHGIYLGDQCEGADVADFRIRGFQGSGLSVNTGVTNTNNNIRIARGLIKSTALAADSSATNGGIDMAYQGAAASGGNRIAISDVQISITGAMGFYATGYGKMSLNNVSVEDWGGAPGGSYAGIKLVGCHYATLDGCKSLTDAANNAGNTIHHVFLQDCNYPNVIGGGAWNTGSSAQATGLNFNSSTASARAVGFDADKGSGSWSSGAFINPTQNNSSVTYARANAVVAGSESGADVTLDASHGEGNFVVNAAATSILQILPAGEGQKVTLRLTAGTTVKVTNMYLAGGVNFVGTDKDTITLICTSAAGASSLWAELGRSVN